MGLGASMFLIALGLILALAVEVDVGPLDIQTIGWILVLVGIVGIALFFTVWKPRRKVLNPDEVASAPRRVTIDERYDEPRHDAPRYDEPRHDDPRYDDPRYDDPRYDDPRHDEPRHDEPRHDDPRT